MSGIVGIHHSDGKPVDRALFARMHATIAHRGPDRAGQWVQGPTALGHRLLFTTPESLREQQPVTDAAGGCVLVWDGRLDNRDELTGLLKQAGVDLGAGTDPDLALGAYRQWGDDCPRKLIGEFAFAVWNERTRSLFCARDRMGLKPFHYAWDGKSFFFGSEMGPLVIAQDRPPEPDDEMVLAFLLTEFRERDHARTLLRGIKRLPPGHSLSVKDGNLAIARYWDLGALKATIYERDEDYAEHFRSLFREAVRCRLRSHFPIAALVSGGLDSSAILCTAERLSASGGETFPPLDAFTLYAGDPGSDERWYFKDVVDATGVKAHIVPADDDPDPLLWLDAVVRQVESPIVGIGNGASRSLRELMQARGCRVLLSGEGGDQLLDEVGYLADLLAGGHPWRFTREIRAMAYWTGGSPRELAEMACAMLLPPAAKYWTKRLLRGVPPGWLNADLARSVGLRARIREPRHGTRFPSHCQTDTCLHTCGAYYVLKHEVDERGAAANGTEARYPYLDSRLVEFVLSIPADRRTKDGVQKRILREAMRGVLPESVRLRTGKGDWTDSTDRALTALCRRTSPVPLADLSGRMERYINPDGARDLVTRYLNGEPDFRQEVWALVTLDHWLMQLTGKDLT